MLSLSELKDEFSDLLNKIKDSNLFAEYETRCGMSKNLSASDQIKIMNNLLNQFNSNNLEVLKQDVQNSLLMKQSTQATELISNYILVNNHIYSIRQDDKQEMWIYRDGIYVPNAISYIKEISKDILGVAFTSHLCNNIIIKVEVSTYIEKDKFFEVKNPNRVAVKNGILDIIERKLYNFTPDEIHFNKINANFNPEAKCESIQKHFSEVLKSKDDIPTLYEFFGYCLYRDYKIEKAFMLFGDGRNGKGKTVELLKRFLGADNCCNISLEQIENDSFGMANFQNKMANIAADISPTALKNTGKFKQLTGHDMITTNRKNKTYVSFTNYAKMIFCANELPQTQDVSKAFWNRWVLLEFPYTFLPQNEIDHLSKEDNHLVKLADPEHINKLLDENELSGLLNASLDGLKRLFANRDFSNQDGYNYVKVKWIRASDSALSFFIDCIEIDYNSEIETGDMRKAYHEYCTEHKLKIVPDKSFREKLMKEFPTSNKRVNHIQKGNYYCWQSIKLKSSSLVPSIP